MDANLVIANSILAMLMTQGKKQAELADGIGVPRAAMRKTLGGGRSISTIALKKIADYLNASMDDIVKIPDTSVEMNAIHAFMDMVETEGAKEALRVADKVSDLIVFHTRVRKNGTMMMRPVEEKG